MVRDRQEVTALVAARYRRLAFGAGPAQIAEGLPSRRLPDRRATGPLRPSLGGPSDGTRSQNQQAPLVWADFGSSPYRRPAIPEAAAVPHIPRRRYDFP